MKQLVFILFILIGSNAYAKPDKQFGMGYQLAYPADGLSTKIQLNNQMTSQFMLDFFGEFTAFAGRSNFIFKSSSKWDAYGYGSMGLYGYESYNCRGGNCANKNQKSLGFGAGFGIEYNWQKHFPQLPPVFFNIELGFLSVEFDELNYSYTSYNLGLGGHYYFH